MEYMVIMELENGWSLSQMSFHMDSMEWLVESMESICIPYGMHMDSMDSTSHSMESIWNDIWLRLQPFSNSIMTMYSIWEGYGMINSIWTPTSFHMDSNPIPCGLMLHMKSMD